MPKLKHSTTGVVVSVSDDTASRLGVEWTPEKSSSTRKTAAAKAEDK